MQKDGVIAGISGVVAEQNMPELAAYGASKAAVRSFDEAIVDGSTGLPSTGFGA